MIHSLRRIGANVSSVCLAGVFVVVVCPLMDNTKVGIANISVHSTQASPPGPQNSSPSL